MEAVASVLVVGKRESEGGKRRRRRMLMIKVTLKINKASDVLKNNE